MYYLGGIDPYASLILDVALHLQVKVITSIAILFLLNHCLKYLLCIPKSCKATKAPYIIVIHLNVHGCCTDVYLSPVSPAV